MVDEPALTPRMRVRVRSGAYVGQLGTISQVAGSRFLVAIGGWLVWFDRSDLIQAMDHPAPIGILEQMTWRRETRTWPR